MCGIVGFFSERKRVREEDFNRMRDSLHRRGPDGAESVFLNDNRIALGHRRLAIVDLSNDGTQPMSNEDQSVWLTFNGEIYNHRSLSTELIELGHVYKSKCDAETVIHAWEEWGEECLLRFRGIFSFAIWDSNTQTVFCARDHLGVKPFYYQENDETLIVASQPRAFLKNPQFRAEIDANAFVDYLYFGIIPDDKSIFLGVKKLPPGSSLKYSAGKITVKKYWDVKYKPTIFEYEEAKHDLGAAIEDAVNMQLMSDVPYGTFLSGGIDSGLITAMAAKHSRHQIPSITVGFDSKKRDEREYARIVANYAKTRHTEAVFNYETARRLFRETAEVFDEPYALGAGLPLMFISEKTQELGLKVMLAGDGADELFAGYNCYDEIAAQSTEPYVTYTPHEAYLKSKDELRVLGTRSIRAVRDGPEWRYHKFLGTTNNEVLDTQILDSRTYLPDEILTKVDRASMAYGIEVRVPFLDPKLVELAFSIDHKLIYRNGERKALLKDIASNFLPSEAITRRKKGFSIPFWRWMLRPQQWFHMFNTVKNGALVESDLINREQFKREGLFLTPSWLWKLYVAEIWAERWIKD